ELDRIAILSDDLYDLTGDFGFDLIHPKMLNSGSKTAKAKGKMNFRRRLIAATSLYFFKSGHKLKNRVFRFQNSQKVFFQR
ncbi:MAG: hypothetical protein AAGG68_29965, partial [Bacteroidota bacterium]